MTQLEILQETMLQLNLLRGEETRAAAKAAALKTDCRQLEVKIIQLMGELGLGNIGHAGVQADLKYTRVYKPEDWLQIYNRIQRTGEFDLLHKRLSITAMAERFKVGDAVPGVSIVDVPGLVLTRSPGVL